MTHVLTVMVPGLIETGADEVLPLASVGKLLLLAEIARELADGRIDPREELAIDPEDYCGGSGLLTALSPRRWTILDLVRLTAAVSDNTATNALIRRIELDRVNEGAKELGLDRTRVLDRIREPRLLEHPPTFALGTARELAGLAERCAGPEPWARAMLGWLALNTDRTMVAATIPHDPEERRVHEIPDTPGGRAVLRVANKTGTDSGIRADVGVVLGERTLCYAAVGSCAPGEEHRLVAAMRAVGVLIAAHDTAPAAGSAGGRRVRPDGVGKGLTFKSHRGFSVVPMERMRISQLAERSGVPVTTLRFYEDAGLVPAERSAAGYRLYGQEALERLGFIGAAKRLGLPLEEIGELLDVWQRGACAQVKADLRPRLAARLSQAETRRVEVEAFVGALRRALARLDALPDRAGRCDPKCGFPTAQNADRGTRGTRSTRSTRGTVVGLPWPTRAEGEGGRRGKSPVACSLRPGELQQRAERWREILADGRRREIDQGFEVTVPADRAGELALLCVAEQECCPFFDFALRFEGPMAHLEVRAPREARELVEQLTA